MSLRGSAKRWEEQFRRTLVLIAVFTVPAAIAMKLVTVADPDLWWHLRTGQWIAQHHMVPATDPFSSFGIGKPWVAYSWLFELVLYAAYRLGGLLGLLIFKLLMVMAVTAAVYRLVARLQQDFTWRVVLTSVAMISMMGLFTPRPWLFTLLFFSIELSALFAYREGGKAWHLYALAPLFLLWANMHVQFVYGLFVLFLFAIEPPLSRKLATRIPQIRPISCPAAPLWISTAICAAITLVNPYGIRLYATIFDLMTQKAMFKYVTELQALSFRQVPDYLLLAMLLAAVFVIAWTHHAGGVSRAVGFCRHRAGEPHRHRVQGWGVGAVTGRAWTDSPLIHSDCSSASGFPESAHTDRGGRTCSATTAWNQIRARAFRPSPVMRRPTSRRTASAVKSRSRPRTGQDLAVSAAHAPFPARIGSHRSWRDPFLPSLRIRTGSPHTARVVRGPLLYDARAVGIVPCLDGETLAKSE